MIHAVALAVLAAPGPVAQALMDHMSKGIADTKVGDWVTYRADGAAGRVSYWRLAVVGEEKDAAGRDALWVEIDIGQHHELLAPMAQMRMLVGRQGGISRLFMAQGTDRPAEVEPSSLQRYERPRESASGPEELVRSGPERMLMTEAGTVPAVPVEVVYRSTVLKRFWISRKVPLLHLAKLEMPAIQHLIEVRDFGIDAKPRMHLPDPKAPKIHFDPAAGDVP